jgi:calcium-dependent protein kinase
LQQPAQAAKKPPAAAVAAVAAVPQSDRRKTTRRRIVGSNIRDNTSVPLGKKTNFGYQRDFKAKYTLGKLLGHGQFGYTYVAIQKATGMRVAVKTIEKKQVLLQTHISFPC